MNLKTIITGICTLLFLMIGFDKLLSFLKPPCSLESSVPVIAWKLFGAIQILAAILIWLPKYRRPVLIFFFAFMVIFTIVHLVNGTYDIGGSVFMAILLGLLIWDPIFLSGKKS